MLVQGSHLLWPAEMAHSLHKQNTAQAFEQTNDGSLNSIHSVISTGGVWVILRWHGKFVAERKLNSDTLNEAKIISFEEYLDQ